MSDPRSDLRKFIIDNFLFGQESAASPLGDEESLLESGVIDSTGILELVAFVEEHFGLTIADDELLPENLDSIAQLVAFVARKRAVAAV